MGADHPKTATARNNLAELLRVSNRLLEAEPLYQQALASDEKNFGPDHPSLANRLNNLALLYQAQGRYSEAEALLTRSLFILEKALGQDHPEVSTVLNNLGAFHFEQGNWAKAAGYYRQSTNLVIRRSRRGTEVVGKPMVGKIDSEAERWSFGFWRLVKAEYRLADFEKPSARDLARDTFLTAQWALGSKAATSLAQMAVRQATGEGELAKFVRERQDLVGEWQALDRSLIVARSQSSDKRDASADAVLQARLAVIDFPLG